MIRSAANGHMSPSCRSVQRDASAFLDGRLSARARGQVQHHLRQCAACLSELQQMARLSRAMHNLPPHRVADGMARRLQRRHDGTRAPVAERAAVQWSSPRGRTFTRRIAAVVLAAAGLPLVFWFGYRSGLTATAGGPTTPATLTMPTVAEATPLPAVVRTPGKPTLQPRRHPSGQMPQIDEPAQHLARPSAPRSDNPLPTVNAKLAVEPLDGMVRPLQVIVPGWRAQQLMDSMLRDLQAFTGGELPLDWLPPTSEPVPAREAPQ